MGLFSGKRKKDEIKSVTGFVLLSKPQWDRYLFCADFQSDWGIDLDAGKVIGLEGEDVVKARLGSVNLTVTFMDFPLKNEELPIRTDHAAHIIVLADGEGELEKIRDQALQSLMKQEAALEKVS
ncbi:MAG: hypothetical protein IJT05_09740 [Lachnospiraceae bacterium]|nr:hypothetical protein [Lachnospiraceae bacterium]